MRIALSLFVIGLAAGASPQSLEDQTVSRLAEYLRIDTINPPGNESRAVDFFAKLLDAEGIAYESAESAPGRGNLWARLEGGSEPALILLNHTDVVPADESYWTTDPLSGEIRDGYLWGRGALDMKGMGIMELLVLFLIKRHRVPHRRDIIFLAVADEELALATADRRHRIDGLDTGLKWLEHGLALHDGRCLHLEEPTLRRLDGPLAVNGVAKRIDDTPEKTITHGHRKNPAGRLDLVTLFDA